jgi:N-acetylmuramoyl-L-alanine amidase
VQGAQVRGTAGFEHAQRLREGLERRPQQQRTRLEYDRVLDAYRAVYHGNPASPRADASIDAVADLLAEEGRIFQDNKALHDAVGQYEFLRRQYPGSRYRFSALLAEGEIYTRDLGDGARGKAAFREFLKLYPRSPLAAEARADLANPHRQEWAAAHGHPQRSADGQSAYGKTPPTAGRRNTVLQAAIGSRQPQPARRPSPGLNSNPSPSPRQEALPSAERGPANGAGLTAGMPPAQSASQPSPDANPSAAPPNPYTSTYPDQSAALAGAGGMAADNERRVSSVNSGAEQNLQAAPPRRGPLPLVTSIRHWSTMNYTRVAIDLQDQVQYEAARVPHPDRIIFDLHGARLSPQLLEQPSRVADDGFLKAIRVAQFADDVTRIVLDVSDVSDYSAFYLPNPWRLIIDVHGRAPGSSRAVELTGRMAPPDTGTGAPAYGAVPNAGAARVGIGRVSAPLPAGGESLAEVAMTERQPSQVKATPRPTTAPIVAQVPGTRPAPQLRQRNELEALNAEPGIGRTAEGARANPSSGARRQRPVTKGEFSRDSDIPAGEVAGRTRPPLPIQPAEPAPVPEMSRTEPTMVRALGLKINRIVIDPGHGGHDSGTLGPGGIEEKNVVLDVALRLGKLLKERLGADVIFTRDTDTFIPLETRTAIANKAQADLFISIHANSSQDPAVRGVETYYLNFTTSTDALEVAARENAVSDQSIYQLSDLVKKIALQDKINESREFAEDVDQSLYAGLESGNLGLRDRGVKKAPFVVLIGANMPSILAEISFLTNPTTAEELREPAYRERIADALYRGVARYVSSLNGVRLAENSGTPGPTN